MTNTKLKEVLTPIWEDRIKRETALYVSIQFSDQNPLREWAMEKEHIYSQICHQVGFTLSWALEEAREKAPEASAEDVLNTLVEIAREEHDRYLGRRSLEEARQKYAEFKAAKA